MESPEHVEDLCYNAIYQPNNVSVYSFENIDRSKNTLGAELERTQRVDQFVCNRSTPLICFYDANFIHDNIHMLCDDEGPIMRDKFDTEFQHDVLTGDQVKIV